MRILVLDGNSSQCLPIIRSFYKRGHKITLICPSKFSSGYFSRYAHKKIIWPKITGNEERFYSIFLEHIRDHSYDLVLGFSDVSTSILSYHKGGIEKYVNSIVPAYSIYTLAGDKFKTMNVCMENDIPCPFTINAESFKIDEIDTQLSCPVVVKPKKGVGAVGFRVYNDFTKLKKDLPTLKNKFGELLIQEYIPNQKQFTAEVFCDENSDLKTCVISEKTRFFPIVGGTSSCNVTILNPEMVVTTKKLMKVLKWTGSANVDFIYDPRDDSYKVIEINPRIGATVKMAFTAGIDFSDMILCLVNNKKIYSKMNYKEGIVMRNLMLDLLWFFFSSFKSKRSTYPSFFKFFNKNTTYQSIRWDDPFPFIGLIMSNFIKYSNIRTIKNKLGISSNGK